MQKQVFTKAEEIKRVIPLAGNRRIALDRPVVMGILNVTPDSFSDGGRFASLDRAVEHALVMIDEGADIIDVGGESTRPGAEPVAPEEELRRVVPVIESIRRHSDICISVDTYHAATAEAALDAGADMINDISSMRFDTGMVDLVAKRKTPVILMHMKGTPGNMQENPGYVDCVGEITEFFAERIEYCRRHDVDETKLILDPGIGFGKRLVDNLDLLGNLSRFRTFGLPLLVGVSRKSFIGMLHASATRPEQRLGGSVAAMVTAVRNGADIVRVHDVAPSVEALKVVQGIDSIR